MANLLKRILIGGILTATALTGGCKDKVTHDQIKPEKEVVSTYTGLVSKLTKANQELRNLPNELYGAKKVEKYEVPNAKHCLVHIKQTHFKEQDLNKHKEEFRDFAEKKYKSSYNEINNTQENIAYILGELKARGSSEIFSEGCITPISKEDLRAHYNQRINYLVNSGFYKDEFENKDFEKFMHIPGADLHLGMNGIIKILQTESEKILSQAHNAENHNEYHNPREDYVLETVAKSDKYFAPLIFGKGHNFKDNIDKWNSQNPDNKFSLIEITPKSYKEK